MPWCDDCNVYLAPNSLQADGTCPTCDTPADTADMSPATAVPQRAPWHFWLMVIALVAYLGWRLIEGVAWLAQQI